MADALKTRTLILRYEGLFDFQGLYDLIVGFFVRRNYDYVEKKWKEKDASPVGREITVDMTPFRKVNEYIKYEYTIQWKSIDKHEVEVVREGKPVRLTHARMYVSVNAQAEVDWQGFGKTKPGLSNFVNKRVIDKELKQYRRNLQREMQSLLDEIKEFLHMEATRTEKVHV